MKRIRAALLTISAATCLFHSCVTQSKVQQTRSKLTAQDSLLQSYSKEVSQLEEQRKKKEKLN